MYDWVSYFEYLQSILLEFDATGAPTEPIMVRYFKKGLKPFIKAKINQDAYQLDSFEELVTKVVKAEAKASLQPSSYVCLIDHYCLQGNWPVHTTAHKVQI